MMNLVILTTAITRGEFHLNSLGKFYKLYNIILKSTYNVFHIINLDLPDKLKNKFDKNYSLKLFDKIIPSFVNKIIIDNKTPGFLNAYKNVVSEAIKLNLNDKETLYWWFEDDWDTEKFNKNLFNIINLFPKEIPLAFNSVISSPLGSFRGGPIMTAKYFKKYFDIVTNNIANNTCDPERQVCRWISGIKRSNGRKIIERNIENDKFINIIFFYHNTEKININEFPLWWYNNQSKYNKYLNFNYHAIKSNDLKIFSYGKVDFENKCIDFVKLDFNKILKTIGNQNGINYICIKPFIFTDIGRIFNKMNNLNKWISIDDNTTYI